MNDTHLVRELQRRMALASLSQKRLALIAGLNETAVRDIVTGRSRHPRHDTLQKLAQALDCTVIDLIEEQSDSAARTGEDADAFLLVGQYDPEQNKNHVSMPPNAEQNSEFAFRASWIARLTHTPVNQLAMITMDGDSMSPTIGPDDNLLVDLTQWSAGADGVYVLRNDSGILVKRLTVDPLRHRVAIGNDNPAYPELPPVALSDLDLVGRIIWVGRRI